MVVHAFYAAWDSAINSAGSEHEGDFRELMEEEKSEHIKEHDAMLEKAKEAKEVQAFVSEFIKDEAVSVAAADKLKALIKEVKETAAEHAKHAKHEEGHHHHDDGPMPLLTMPEVVQKYGQPQPEVHIGWGDIYLDLILVGVAFNGGTLLKHAFYLCHPAESEHGEHGAHDAHAAHDVHDVHNATDAHAIVDPHAIIDPHAILAHHHRLLHAAGEGEVDMAHHDSAHPPCVGLATGTLHVLAFGVPILGAWLKETTFRARFKAHNFVSRFLEVGTYLLMIIGASCEEDVQVLQEDRTFWMMLTVCVLTIDITYVGRYMQIACGHPDKDAKTQARQTLLRLVPGTLCYAVATFMGSMPESADDVLLYVLGRHAGHQSHMHLYYTPLLLVLGANTPLFFEILFYLFSKYKPALPLNHVFVLHRCTEIFMVLLGESVLQLITSQMPSGAGLTPKEEMEIDEKFSGMQIGGFILTLTVMHSFTIQEPGHDKHVIAQGGVKASFWMVFFIFKCLAVWLVGVGIKIALYDPVAPADAFFSHEQRLQLGLSSALCYFFSGLMLPLHKKGGICEHYQEVFGNPVTALGFFAWIANIVCMYKATFIVLPPYEYIMLQAGLGIFHMLVTHLELIWIPTLMANRRKEFLKKKKSSRALLTAGAPPPAKSSLVEQQMALVNKK